MAIVSAGRQVHWRELSELVGHAAQFLSDPGTLDDKAAEATRPSSRPNLRQSPVAVVGSTRIETVILVLAAVEAEVPVALIHPRARDREQAAQIEHLSPRILIDEDWELPSGVAPVGPAISNVRSPVGPKEPLAVIATSGSTGQPKWVVLSRGAFVAAAAASEANLGWQEDDQWLLAMPLAHVGGLSILIRCLLARKTVVLHEASRFDAEEVAEVIDRQKVTLVSLVPTMLHRLLALSPPWRPPKRLRAILLGGAAAPSALLAEAADRGLPVLTTYGLTEACSQVATQPYGSHQTGELGCGPPVAGTEVRIDDAGQILVRGPQLMTGYLTEEPLAAGAWLATGDLGRLDEAGNLHVEGRRADRIVTGGENVDPLEVENALLEHPEITAAVVVGLPHEEWGQQVAAAVVFRQGGGGSPLDLESFLELRLAPYKRPRDVIAVETVPVSSAGKTDRAAVAELFSTRQR